MSKNSKLHHCEVPFAQVPWELIRNPNISASAKAVYCYLASRPKDWVLRVSDVQNHMKEGRDRVTKSLRELCASGYLVKEQVRQEGQFSTTIYKLQHSPLTEMPSTVLPLTVNQTLQKIDNTDIDNTEPPIVPQGDGYSSGEVVPIDDIFEDFWMAYPKNGRGKGSKKNALKSFTKAFKKTSIQQIAKGLKDYERYLRATGELNKDASTWLNGECWESDYRVPELPKGNRGSKGETGFSQAMSALYEIDLSGGDDRGWGEVVSQV